MLYIDQWWLHFCSLMSYPFIYRSVENVLHMMTADFNLYCGWGSLWTCLK